MLLPPQVDDALTVIRRVGPEVDATVVELDNHGVLLVDLDVSYEGAAPEADDEVFAVVDEDAFSLVWCCVCALHCGGGGCLEVRWIADIR